MYIIAVEHWLSDAGRDPIIFWLRLGIAFLLPSVFAKGAGCGASNWKRIEGEKGQENEEKEDEILLVRSDRSSAYPSPFLS